VQVYSLTPNKDHLALTIDYAMTLALATFYTGDPRYAQRARDKIYLWFLDPAQGMRPSLRGAAVVAEQVVKGRQNSGRPEGINDLASLPDLLNTVALLAKVHLTSPAGHVHCLTLLRERGILLAASTFKGARGDAHARFSLQPANALPGAV
jgi:hypothetical protein